MKNAFIRLTSNEKFKNWINIKASQCSLDMTKIKKKVNNLMDPKYIIIEFKEGKKWNEVNN